jgi:hypothetical protein
MESIDPGHIYELTHIDGSGKSKLVFVKREGAGYPGNTGHHEGTNIQEVVRALIDRLFYLDDQIPDRRNWEAVAHLREVIVQLETRAAKRHGRRTPRYKTEIEEMPVCAQCGHIGCKGECDDHMS